MHRDVKIFSGVVEEFLIKIKLISSTVAYFFRGRAVEDFIIKIKWNEDVSFVVAFIISFDFVVFPGIAVCVCAIFA